MGRLPRITLDKSAYAVVVAMVADYSRMKRTVESGSGTREKVAEFTRRIAAIDNALTVICDGEREEVKRALIIDIGERRGFERAVSREFYNSRNTFEKRKHEAVALIAQFMLIV
jgi:hypothetical protein